MTFLLNRKITILKNLQTYLTYPERNVSDSTKLKSHYQSAEGVD